MAVSCVSDSIAQTVVIADRKCELCDVNNVTWKCLNCNEVMCRQCKEIHIKSKASKNHKIVSLIDVDKHEINYDTDSTKCFEHPNEDMLMYCASCDIPVCRCCIANESHRNHCISVIEDVIDKKKIELSNIAQKFRVKVKKHEETLQTTIKRQNEIDAEISKTIEELQHRNEDMKQKLDVITSTFVEQLHCQQRLNQKHTSDIERRLQNEIRELNILVFQCERKRSEGKARLVTYVTDMKDKLDQYTTCNPPNIDHPLKLVTKDVDIQDLKALFGEFVDSESEIVPWQHNKKSRNIPAPYTEVPTMITFTFKRVIDCVKATGYDVSWMWRYFYKQKVWVWCFGYKGLSLVTLDGNVVQDVKTESNVYDVASVKSGEILLTTDEGKVMKLTPDGRLTDVFTATGYKTLGITSTVNNNVIVSLYSDKEDSKLVEITVDGKEVRTIQYNAVDNSVLFVYPNSISTNINGDIVVVDGHSTVVAIDKTGQRRYTYSGQREGLNQVFNPQCVVTDQKGNVIVSDVGNSVLHMFSIDGKFLQFLFTKEHRYDEPRGLSIDQFGMLWICYGNTVRSVKYL